MPHKNKKAEGAALKSLDVIERKIYFIRHQNVMLDSDLATLYGITTFNLNKAVKRNSARFPEDFMFQITGDEFKCLTFQIGMSNKGRGGRRTMPYVFTEQGVAMLSGVLNSERAIQANIAIMRAFVSMRRMLSANEKVRNRLDAIEDTLGEHDEHFKKVFTAIRLLMEPPTRAEKQIGYIKSPGRKNT